MSQILGMLIENLSDDGSRMAKTQQLLESQEICEVKSRKNCRALSSEAEMSICHSLGPCQQTFIENLDTVVL